MREVFAVDNQGRLYSFTDNAYYLIMGGSGSYIFWNTSNGSNLWRTAVNTNNGKTQLFLGGNGNDASSWSFCPETGAAGNINGGYHFRVFSNSNNKPPNCIPTNLYLTPVS